MILKYFDANKSNSLNQLEQILYKKKLKQKNESSKIKKIINNVKSKGDYAVIQYERQFFSEHVVHNTIT